MGIGAAAAGIAAAGAIGGAVISSNAASNASKAQQAGFNSALGLQTAEWQQQQANEAPYLQAGNGAISQLSTLYGLGTANSNATGAFTNAAGGQSTVNPNASFYLSPDYNFALTQGLQGLTAKGAATNGTNNGATQKAEIAYAGNLASGQYDNYKAGLLSLAGIGGNAAAGLNSATGQTATNSSNLAAQNGSNIASAALGQGSISSNLTSSLSGIASQYLSTAHNNTATASSNGIGNALGGGASDASLVAHQGGAGF